MKIHLSILEIGAIRFAVASRGKADLEVCQCVTKQMCEKKKTIFSGAQSHQVCRCVPRESRP